MAVIDISTVKELLNELERVTILAELEVGRRQQDAGRRQQEEERVRAIRTSVMNNIPADAGGLDGQLQWATLPDARMDALHLEVLKALAVLRQIANPGPSGPHIMSSSYPGNWTVLIMLGTSTLLTLLLLLLIWYLWDNATYSCRQEKEVLETAKQTESNKRAEAARLRVDGKHASEKSDQLKKDIEVPQQEANLIAKGIDAAENRAARATAAIARARELKGHNVQATKDAIEQAKKDIERGEGEFERILKEVKGSIRQDLSESVPTLPPVTIAPGKSAQPPNSQADTTTSIPADKSLAIRASIDISVKPAAASSNNETEQLEMESQIQSVEESLRSLTSRIKLMKKWAGLAEQRLAQANEEWESAEEKFRALLGRAERLENEAAESAVEVRRTAAAFDENNKCPPSEQAIVRMVMLVGAAGGCLRLIASLASYIGNRELRKSWLPHYCLMPFQGAALATIVYLVVRAGLLSATVTEADDADKLNLFNIYLYAGVSGMFAKDVTVKLRELLSALFRSKSTESDPLGQSAAPSGSPTAQSQPPQQNQ